jgi:hypothetical protein
MNGVDTDLLPAYQIMKTEFSDKPVVCVAPPHRQHHRELQRVAADCVVIKVSQIERSLFSVVPAFRTLEPVLSGAAAGRYVRPDPNPIHLTPERVSMSAVSLL